jgi:hypothetical protein
MYTQKGIYEYTFTIEFSMLVEVIRLRFIYICMYVCMYVYIYTYTYMYIYICIP